jgi:hypothetical protein
MRGSLFRLNNAAVQKSDLISIAVISACALAALTCNWIAGVPLLHSALAMIGAFAYWVLTGLDARSHAVPCDYVQTGEAATGSFVLIAAMPFITGDPLLIAGIVLAAMLIFEFYLNVIIAPVSKEYAINGVVVLAIVAICTARVAWVAPRHIIEPGGRVLTGYLTALSPGPIALVAALLVSAVIYVIVRLLGPELRSYALGTDFSYRMERTHMAITAGLIAARGILVSITLLFAGWLCGIGISAERLYRGPLPDAFSLLAILAFSQCMLLVAHAAGPFIAAGCAAGASYFLFFLQLHMRVFRYDRHEKL